MPVRGSGTVLHAEMAADFLRRRRYNVEYAEGSTSFTTDKPIAVRDKQLLDHLVSFPYAISENSQ